MSRRDHKVRGCQIITIERPADTYITGGHVMVDEEKVKEERRKTNKLADCLLTKHKADIRRELMEELGLWKMY